MFIIDITSDDKNINNSIQYYTFNPNTLIELGLAIRHLNKKNIIIIFNENRIKIDDIKKHISMIMMSNNYIIS